jgi:hypothetical protein
MQSRRYLERLWRVPKDQGALHMFATLTVKALRKHGWPADWREGESPLTFYIFYLAGDDRQPVEFDEMPHDFSAAADDCVCNLASQHDVQLSVFYGRVRLLRYYTIKKGGFIAPCLHADGLACICGPDADFICSHKKWDLKCRKTKTKSSVKSGVNLTELTK